MNQNRLDDFARALAQSSSRRAVLKTLIFGAAGIVAAATGAEEALAKPCTGNQDCNSNQLCCNKQCVERNRQHCSTCEPCKSGQLCCEGACVDPSTDHCDSCTDVCVNQEVCCASLIFGGHRCANLQTDSAHCGSCTTLCGERATCNKGTCICPAGFTPCTGTTRFRGREITATICCGTGATCTQGSDGGPVCRCGDCQQEDSGGACRACTFIEFNDGNNCCYNGSCVEKCPGRCLACQDGVCKQDDSKCHRCEVCQTDGSCKTCKELGQCCSQGNCVAVCPQGEECVDGQCKPKKCTPSKKSLPGGRDVTVESLGIGIAATTSCGPCEVCTAQGRCVSTCSACQTCQTSSANPGGTCVSTCGPCQTCANSGAAAGTCVSTCSAGQTCVNGVCTSGCSPPCDSCHTCQNGQCVPLSCPSGQICCNGACTDPLSDAANCGACGTACSGSGLICSGGVCTCDVHNCYTSVGGSCVFCPGFADPKTGVACQDGTLGRGCYCDITKCWTVNVVNNAFVCTPACTLGCQQCIEGSCFNTCPVGVCHADTAPQCCLTFGDSTCETAGLPCCTGCACVGGSCQGVCGVS